MPRRNSFSFNCCCLDASSERFLLAPIFSPAFQRHTIPPMTSEHKSTTQSSVYFSWLMTVLRQMIGALMESGRVGLSYPNHDAGSGVECVFSREMLHMVTRILLASYFRIANTGYFILRNLPYILFSTHINHLRLPLGVLIPFFFLTFQLSSLN